jgi:hypothetical protein
MNADMYKIPESNSIYIQQNLISEISKKQENQSFHIYFNHYRCIHQRDSPRSQSGCQLSLNYGYLFPCRICFTPCGFRNL